MLRPWQRLHRVDLKGLNNSGSAKRSLLVSRGRVAKLRLNREFSIENLTNNQICIVNYLPARDFREFKFDK
jgi:hypothetical protein